MHSTTLLISGLLLAASAAAAPLKLPSYIKPCSRNDPKLNECALKNAIAAIPGLIPGDRKYNVPALNPLKISQIKVNDGGDKSVGLSIIFNDVKFHGVKEAVIKAVDFLLKENKANIKVYLPVGTLISKYDVDGKILVLPIKGSGDCNITLTDLDLDFTIQWKMEKKDDGLEYIKPTKTDIKYELSRAYIRLDNLFGGDKALGDNMNKFLDENWKDIVKEIGPAIADAIDLVITQILTNIAQLVPYDNVFPEKV